jgi:DNA-binding MarR family transcriptional regulator
MNNLILEYEVLNTIHGSEGPITQRDISRRIGWSVSSVNFALRLLAVKGFIRISGSNHKRLRYHLTPRGILEKSVLAYNFLKRQNILYEEARKGLLGKLNGLKDEGVTVAAVYGWTPVTEVALLYLLSEGVKVSAIYVNEIIEHSHCNRIALKTIDQFQPDCDVLVLLEPLAEEFDSRLTVRKTACYPIA